MTTHKVSVSEALQMLESGQSLSGFSIDFDRIKVEALDAMKLNKAGVMVPEEAVWYNDEDIAYDEDFEGDWMRVEDDGLTMPQQETQQVNIVLKKDVKRWIDSKNINLEKLIEQLLDGFYQTQKRVLGD